jgi:predicted alpha/beta-hydrolase family hydrolase
VAAVRVVETSLGPARLRTHPARRPRLTLVLGHGAGGGIEASDLVALANALPMRGISVVRMEQPWRVAGRKAASPPPQLDRAWIETLTALAPRTPLVVGGRSAGARVACRTALTTGAVAVVALAFPLHPPGRPERSRADELLDAGVPTVVVQGTRDSFGVPAEFPVGVNLHEVADADHSFRVPKGSAIGQDAAYERVVGHVLDFLGGLA